MKRKESILLLLFTTLSLMVVALYNGYGLTWGDTGAYIYCGINNAIPMDRSPFYGWFIRYTSLWTSLWLTLFTQCLLTAYLLVQLIRFITRSDTEDTHPDLPPIRNKRFFMATVVLTIVSFTTIPWVTAYLMPDVFGATLLLATLLYLADKRKNIPLHSAYVVIIAASILIHNSHALIAALFSGVLLLWGLVRKQVLVVKKSIVLLAVSVLSWVCMCSINAGNGYGFVFSRGSHVFMVTKFAETGILKSYLDDNCGKKNLKICKYKDNIPAYSWDFLWQPESPLYLTGGWDSNRVEYNNIIHDVLSTPKYQKMFVTSALTGTLRELTQIQAPDEIPAQAGWASPAQRIGTYYDDELNEYHHSRQNNGHISAAGWNYIYFLFFALSSVWVLLNMRLVSRDVRFIYAVFFLFSVINAMVTATGSTVHYRYQNRIFWILPAINVILMVWYYWNRYQAARADDVAEKN